LNIKIYYILIYTVLLKENINQAMEQVSLRHIKTKGDLKSDDPDKNKDDIGFEKILERK